MRGFSDTFAHYFYKNFPQYKKKLSIHQEEKIQKLAEHMTFKKNHQELWESMESNLFLLSELTNRIKPVINKNNPRNERMIFLTSAFLLICFLSILFKKKVDAEVIGTLSGILNIFGACLKDVCFF